MMNENTMKGLLKIIKSVVPADAMQAAVLSLFKAAIDYKNEVAIEPDKGEAASVLTLYEVNDTIYTAVAVLNEQNQVVRFENIKPANELIELIKANF